MATSLDEVAFLFKPDAISFVVDDTTSGGDASPFVDVGGGGGGKRLARTALKRFNGAREEQGRSSEEPALTNEKKRQD